MATSTSNEQPPRSASSSAALPPLTAAADLTLDELISLVFQPRHLGKQSRSVVEGGHALALEPEGTAANDEASGEEDLEWARSAKTSTPESHFPQNSSSLCPGNDGLRMGTEAGNGGVESGSSGVEAGSAGTENDIMRWNIGNHLPFGKATRSSKTRSRHPCHAATPAPLPSNNSPSPLPASHAQHIMRGVAPGAHQVQPLQPLVLAFDPTTSPLPPPPPPFPNACPGHLPPPSNSSLALSRDTAPFFPFPFLPLSAAERALMLLEAAAAITTRVDLRRPSCGRNLHVDCMAARAPWSKSLPQGREAPLAVECPPGRKRLRPERSWNRYAGQVFNHLQEARHVQSESRRSPVAGYALGHLTENGRLASSQSYFCGPPAFVAPGFLDGMPHQGLTRPAEEQQITGALQLEAEKSVLKEDKDQHGMMQVLLLGGLVRI